MSQLLRPPHLAHGIIGNELRPYGLDDAQSVDVPCVILGKVYPRQGAVIPDESLEASAALHEHGVAQASCVDEMLVTVDDRETLIFHDGRVCPICDISAIFAVMHSDVFARRRVNVRP